MAASPAGDLTLGEAIALAIDHNPRLRVATAAVDEAQGRLVGARTYPFNPEVEVGGAARIGPDDTVVDFDVGVGQRFELGGQRGWRTEVARADMEAARAARRRALQVLVAEVRLAFVAALEARERLALAKAEAEVARELLALTRQRLEAGIGTQLDVNVAAAEAGRAEQVVGMRRGEYVAARAVLSEVLGLEATDLPEPKGALAPTQAPLPTVAELVEAAEAHRADLEALRAARQAAVARVALERAEVWPDLQVAVGAGREDGTDTLVGVRVGVELPFIQRNQGPIAEAEAAVRRVEAMGQARRLSVVREVVAAHARYRAAMAALEALRQRVVGTTEANVALLRAAFEAGKADWTDVLVMRRTLFEVQRALVATQAQARRARIWIDLAIGRLPEGAAQQTE